MKYSQTKMTNSGLTFDGQSQLFHDDNEKDLGKGTLVLVVSLASLTGLWGFSCLVLGLFHSGSLFSFGSSWLSAVIGM